MVCRLRAVSQSRGRRGGFHGKWGMGSRSGRSRRACGVGDLLQKKDRAVRKQEHNNCSEIVSPSGRGRAAKREPDRAKPQLKRGGGFGFPQILRPSPYPLPKGRVELGYDDRAICGKTA